MPVVRQLIKMPPKAVFQFLCDVEAIEEIGFGRVRSTEGTFEEGFEWTEGRFFPRRWCVTEFDRRALFFAAESKGLTMKIAVKKGGTGSGIAVMTVDGDTRAVAKFWSKNESRLEQLAVLLDA